MRKLTLSVCIALIVQIAFAGEGMWLPLFLKQLNESEMQRLGMKITAEDIYSVNKGSLKDAIVSFGGFCTGEIISAQGLLLTNHHCGESIIQSHTTLENNYLDDGFWARDKSAELPNTGLYVTFIVRIEDVTRAALEGISNDLSERERQSQIDQNLNKISKNAKKENWQDVLIRPFFHGNQYFMFITETYRDVRLVGAPPSAIGKFGADTDNWVWPRHTGDFSLFRVYADKNNRPAAYSKDNVPLKPRHFLPISLDGVAENDFTMVFGFPGRTDQYLPSYAVQQIVETLNPLRVQIRDKSLSIMGEAMRADKQVKIQYTSKQARLANSWKKWIGEMQGIERTGSIARKQRLEAEFLKRVQGKPEWKKEYGNLLNEFKELYAQLAPYVKSRELTLEVTARNIEIFQLCSVLNTFVTAYQNGGMNAISGRLDRLTGYLDDFYKNYNANIDRQIFAALLQIYFQEMPGEHLGAYAIEQYTTAGKNGDAFAQAILDKTLLINSEYMVKTANATPEALLQAIQSDIVFRLYRDMMDAHNQQVMTVYNELNPRIELLQRRYMQALMEVFPDKTFYPDANGTMRITYGQVKGYQPKDAVRYEHVTYLSGVIEKYIPGDYEFDVPQKLRDLYQRKDFGQYADTSGDVPVCFIGSNHTTGGNSGSPVIDAWGNLVGLNFDRAWEGVMSDLTYDPSICRNIMVDARYILFIIEKYAGATHLIQEMRLVRPKKIEQSKTPAPKMKQVPPKQTETPLRQSEGRIEKQ